MVDALASGASTGNGVEVRVLFWAPMMSIYSIIFNVLAVDLHLVYTLLYTQR